MYDREGSSVFGKIMFIVLFTAGFGFLLGAACEFFGAVDWIETSIKKGNFIWGTLIFFLVHVGLGWFIQNFAIKDRRGEEIFKSAFMKRAAIRKYRDKNKGFVPFKVFKKMFVIYFLIPCITMFLAVAITFYIGIFYKTHIDSDNPIIFLVFFNPEAVCAASFMLFLEIRNYKEIQRHTCPQCQMVSFVEVQKGAVTHVDEREFVEGRTYVRNEKVGELTDRSSGAHIADVYGDVVHKHSDKIKITEGDKYNYTMICENCGYHDESVHSFSDVVTYSKNVD